MMENQVDIMGRMRVDEKASFIYFVYPFLFDPDEFTSRVNAVESASFQGTKRELPVWEPEKFPEDDLHAHIADYLNRREGKTATARLWHISSELDRVYGFVGKADWSLLLRSKEELPFKFGGKGRFTVELVLFRIGVGFLAINARPTTADADRWCDFLHYFRFTRGERGVKIRASARRGPDEAKGPFFPEPAGGLAAHPDGTGPLSELCEALLQTVSLEEEERQWWRDVFVPGQLIPFASLYIDDLPENDRPGMLYRIRNFFHSGQEIHPTADDLRADNTALLQYAEGDWFTFSLEGGTFTAFDAPKTPFFRETMPNHLKNQYYLLFLLALQQRFALIMLSEEVASRWLPTGQGLEIETRTAAFGRIRDGLLLFTASGYFKQVMQRENHHRCYLKWQEIFQVDILFQEVTGEVAEMHDYLMMRLAEQRNAIEEQKRRSAQEAADRADRLARLLNLVAWVIGIPAFATFVLSATGGVSKWATAYWVIGGFLIGGLMFLLFNRLIMRWLARKRADDKGERSAPRVE